jgi:multicomponent Na+:H+ antiporter subunit D
MTEHLPALQVVIPLLAAPLCVLLRHPRAAWAVFAATALTTLLIAAQLVALTLDGTVLRYALGGWPAPFGIEYVVDAANALLLLLVSLLAVAVAIYAPRAVDAEVERPRIYLYYCCLCLYLAGLLGIGITGDAFNVFVFLEISSLSGYALIAMGRRRRALLAAFRYLIMGTVGGTFVLIGIGLLYGLTGSLNMTDLAERVPPLYGNRALTAALGFIAVGLAIKAAVFPLHAWQPDAYSEMPSCAIPSASSASIWCMHCRWPS